MSEHVNGTNRNQTVLFPDTIDKYVDKENPVRFIDAFVDSLNLEKLSFKHSILTDTGRPSHNPSDLLKLYVYGYLNQVRSSRKLEKECHRNIEVMWLMKKLSPDHKTIADFRKDNVCYIKPVFKEFVYLCRSLDLYGAQLVAIHGTKFKAVNSRSNNLNEKTVALRLKQTEEKIAEYLKEMDQNDTVASDEDESIKVDGIKEKIGKLEEEKQSYEQIQNQMKATGQKEISLVDPDSRLMRVDSQRFTRHLKLDFSAFVLSMFSLPIPIEILLFNAPFELMQSRQLSLNQLTTKKHTTSGPWTLLNLFAY